MLRSPEPGRPCARRAKHGTTSLDATIVCPAPQRRAAPPLASNLRRVVVLRVGMGGRGGRRRTPLYACWLGRARTPSPNSVPTQRATTACLDGRPGCRGAARRALLACYSVALPPPTATRLLWGTGRCSAVWVKGEFWSPSELATGKRLAKTKKKSTTLVFRPLPARKPSVAAADGQVAGVRAPRHARRAALPRLTSLTCGRLEALSLRGRPWPGARPIHRRKSGARMCRGRLGSRGLGRASERGACAGRTRTASTRPSSSSGSSQ